jgi:hypothetical protein
MIIVKLGKRVISRGIFELRFAFVPPPLNHLLGFSGLGMFGLDFYFN